MTAPDFEGIAQRAVQQSQRELFFRSVVFRMKADGAGLEAAIQRFRADAMASMALRENTDPEFQEWAESQFDETADWMRARIEQARELAALADGRQ